jgi:hypothetical protein
MNIQLIYTTGLKDFDALQIFPNIIRVRNNQLDRRSGNHLLTLEPATGHLESMRLMHAEERHFGEEHREHGI